MPDITVVVCTHNRADMLCEALRSLSRLRLPQHLQTEILVVDNASTDHTQRVVSEAAATSSLPLRAVREMQRGIVPARNRALAEARGEWIAFFDDDQLADEDWLSQLHRAALKQNVLCVGGAVRLKLPVGCRRRLSPVCRMLLGETVGREAAQYYDYRFTPGAGNLMLHRSVLDRVGHFDPRFHARGEDTDLFLRVLGAGFAAYYTPAAVIHHVIPPERLTDQFLLQLSRRMAEGMAVDERHAVGPWRFPVRWTARLIQFLGVFFPRWCCAAVCQNREAQLGARCRLVIARRRLADGWKLMMPRRRNSRLSPVDDPPSRSSAPSAAL